MVKVGRVTEWLNRIVTAERPAASVIAFNVGLFETEDGYCAYLIGAARFDPSDDDWACDEAFTPAERHLPLPRADLGPVDWAELQDEVVQEVERFLDSPMGRNSFLNSAQAVTVGFDESNLVRVR